MDFDDGKVSYDSASGTTGAVSKGRLIKHSRIVARWKDGLALLCPCLVRMWGEEMEVGRMRKEALA
jgi:hypothetical protein